jgi:hypothetical protein
MLAAEVTCRKERDVKVAMIEAEKIYMIADRVEQGEDSRLRSMHLALDLYHWSRLLDQSRVLIDSGPAFVALLKAT